MENKKAIITGGSHGIGKGIAWELASKGYDIVFSYYNGEEAAKKIQEDVKNSYGVRCACFQGAFENPEEGPAFFAKAVDFLGSLDVMVNNAGVTKFENLLDMTKDTLDLLLNLDFRNYVMMMQCAAVYMKERGIKGSIINITSSRSQQAYPGDGIYGACKAGLNRVIESFALDVAPYGIRINNVAPGAIQVRTEADMDEKASHLLGVYEQLGRKIPMGRMGKPEDIAKAVAYLVSEDASYATGVTLRIDGGLILPGMPEQPVDVNQPWGFCGK